MYYTPETITLCTHPLSQTFMLPPQAVKVGAMQESGCVRVRVCESQGMQESGCVRVRVCESQGM